MPSVQLLAPPFLGVNLDVLLYGVIVSQFTYWHIKCARAEHLGFKVYMVSLICFQPADHRS